MTVRAPIVAPAPMVTNGPIDDVRRRSTHRRRRARVDRCPGGGAATGANSDTARANAEYGIVGAQHARIRRRDCPLARAEDHRRRSRRRQLRKVACVGDEGQIPRLRVLHAGDTDDFHVAVAVETAVQTSGDFAQFQSAYYAPSWVLGGSRA